MAIKPPGWDRTGLEAVRFFLLDPDNGTILGRTPLSWLKITCFYILFYCCLAAFSIGLFYVFLQTIPDKSSGPKWQLDASLIGSNPGQLKLALRSSSHCSLSGLASKPTGTRSSLLTLKLTDGADDGAGDSNINVARRVKEFLDVWNEEVTGNYSRFDVKSLGDCAKYPYGFIDAEKKPIKPCIFMKLNRMIGWVPQPITLDGSDSEALPPAFKDHVEGQNDKNQVFVDCQGKTGLDQELVEDGITFWPASRGFPIKYFPFSGYQGDARTGYQSPLVAVQFDGNKFEKVTGQVVAVECTAFYSVGNTELRSSVTKIEILFQ